MGSIADGGYRLRLDPPDVGRTTGLLFMFMAVSLDQGLLATPYHVSLVERVQATWMVAVSGAAAARFPVGVLRSLFRVRWYNL